MASFDEILEKLHNNAVLQDVDETIIITSTRQFQVPSTYNLTVGYAGDVNSQIVTFQLPLTHEQHSLFECEYKKLKWKNTSSGAEGFSTLRNINNASNGWTCQWEIPPEAMTQAGNLEIAIVLYDLAKSGKIAFAWNTPVYKGFLIGQSFMDIGLILGENETMPAADEILTINTETRMIVAPKGYNTTVANYGDKGISKVYFQVDKYIRGINVLESEIIINVQFNSDITDKTYLENAVKPLTEDGNKVLICWDIANQITNNAAYYTGQFTISVTFIAKNQEKEKKWTSASYSKLSIGDSLLLTDENHIAERDESIIDKAVERHIGESVEQHIDTYFEQNEFSIGTVDY